MQYRYDQLLRADYTPVQIEKFRDYIVSSVVPMCNEIYAQQAKHIGVNEICYHDEEIIFSD